MARLAAKLSSRIRIFARDEKIRHPDASDSTDELQKDRGYAND
jgi:hypothetical protein